MIRKTEKGHLQCAQQISRQHNEASINPTDRPPGGLEEANKTNAIDRTYSYDKCLIVQRWIGSLLALFTPVLEMQKKLGTGKQDGRHDRQQFNEDCPLSPKCFSPIGHFFRYHLDAYRVCRRHSFLFSCWFAVRPHTYQRQRQCQQRGHCPGSTFS